MTRDQVRWLPVALAALCCLLCLASGVSSQLTESGPGLATSTVAGEATTAEDVPGVKPLEIEGITRKPTLESKGVEADAKAEAKKKSTGEFVKPKPEVKKPKESKGADDAEPRTTSNPEDTSTLAPSTEKRPMVELPLLLRGEPIVQSTTPVTPSSPMTESPNQEEAVTLAVDNVSSRARALNVSAGEPVNTLHSNITDLSDVSMDDEDKEIEGGEYIALHNNAANVTVNPLPTATSMCIDGNATYAIGEKVKRGCDEQCLCSEGGKITNCEPMCQLPYVRAGKKNSDPFCHARSSPENPCCAIVVCTDSSPEPEETCVFGNTTITRGQKVHEGCSKTCVCEAGGQLKCQPRCPPNDTASGVNQHDRCVVLQDPKDSCCTITLCDVTLGDHEIKPESSSDMSVNLTDVKVLNSTAIKLKLSSKSLDDVTIEISENNHVWRQVKPTKDGIISDLLPAHGYYVRVVEGARAGPAVHVSLFAEVTKTNVTEKNEKGSCSHRGKTYKIGAEWYDECIAVCFCNETAQTECVTIECPTDFGLDVLDPQCLDWETVPPNHVPKAPNCCPQEVRCRNNGSCTYEGKTYDNWSRLPTNITGCEKECYCEFGNVTCHPVCPSVSQLPPSTLNCKAHEAILTHLPGDECCLHWACAAHSETTVPGSNSTNSAFPGPIAIDSPSKASSELKSESSKPSQEKAPVTSYPWPMPTDTTHPPQPVVPPNSDVVHYPMDPGHPTVPYMGPYNPDFKPTHPSVEEVFHLPAHIEKVPPAKEKSKSKSDSKKPVDAFKGHKDNFDQFPGPLAPDRFPEKIQPAEKTTVKPINPNIGIPLSPNKLPGLNKGISSSDHVEQPQFIPLNVHDHPTDSNLNFAPSNGENIPVAHFDTLLENQAAGPPYGGAIGTRPESANIDPNNIVPSLPKKKASASDVYPGDKGKPSALPPKRGEQIPPRNPNPEAIPDELYHLINLQHPGLIQLDRTPPAGHPGLYDIHQEITSDKGQAPPAPPQQANYFGAAGIPAKKGGAHGKPQIFAQKDENGQTTYHVHTAEVPSTPQQFEELLAHIAQHDPNNNPYQQHYPVGQQPATAPPPPPQAIEPSGQPVPGVPAHLGPHGFVAQVPPGAGQSGFDIPHDIPPIGQYPGILGHGSSNLPSQPAYEISVEELRAINANTVRLMFTVPSVLVGLHGRVEVRYTSDKSNADPTSWKSQTFAPPGDLIDTEDLEFDLSGLKPSTVYRLMIVVKLRDLSNTHTSKIYQVRTLDKQLSSSVPTDISIDSELKVLSVNSTFAEFEWKKFTSYELQFIDGIYLMYKAEDEKTYSVTPLLHRSVNSYILDHLRPSTNYEVHLSTKDIINQANVLVDSKTVNFTTLSEADPYSFDVKVEIKTIKSSDVEVSWSGVPQPQDKYVNIYRAVYQSDSGKEDTSTFKIAKKDSPAKTIIGDLKPGTRYRLWIEVYLTNGKIKKSNVQDFVTKPGVLLPPGASQQQGKLASIPLHEGDYYGPLVIVAIVASLAILSTLILLMMLMKRRTSSKADISPRKTTSAYDNPSYKTCEETVPNGRNKISEHEMTTINGNGTNNAIAKEIA